VVKHLSRLGIAHIAEWDVLAFIYNHGASLASAEKIAALVGYTKLTVGSALESLTAKGLVYRSRSSHGVRLYRSTDCTADDPLQQALRELMTIAADREGRLLIARHLRPAPRGKDAHKHGGLHLAK
jgi:DNA-binding MarR family transcriptional regulator